MKIILLVFLLVCSGAVFASGVVVEIIDPKEIVVDIYDAAQIDLNRRIIIISRKLNKAIAFGIVKK